MQVGLFETLRIEQGRARFLPRHERRLRDAWPSFFREAPPNFTADVASALARTRRRRGLLRVAYELRDGGGFELTTTMRALSPVPARVRVAIARSPRTDAPAARAVKSLARDWVDRLAAPAVFETLVWDEGHGLLEGTRSNLFVVFHGELVTPPVSSGLLPGVVRAALIAAAPGLGWSVVERTVAPGDLKAAAGLLLTGAGIGVAPVAECDGRPVAIDVTAALARRLWGALRKE